MIEFPVYARFNPVGSDIQPVRDFQSVGYNHARRIVGLRRRRVGVLPMHIKSCLAGAALCLALAPPAQAATHNGLTMDELKAVFEAKGQATSDIDDTTIRITDGPLLTLDDCAADGEKKCSEIKISRNYSNVHPTVEAINKWNWTTKIPEASIGTDPGDDKTLHVEMWVTAVGITDEALTDTVDWFETAVSGDDTIDFWKPYFDKDDAK
jgi:hypothetical protein